jgi:small subunit ribosomal protein S16
MVKIRLRRVGGKGQPSYRIVVADEEAPRDGRFLEIVGWYNPRTQPASIHIQEDRVYHWMSHGAQPSEAVIKLFRSVGLLERFERYKRGEALEVLLAEAAAAEAARQPDAKTRISRPAKKAKAQAE